MKKILALLLAVVIAMSVTLVSVSAKSTDIRDEIFAVIKAEHEQHLQLDDDDVNFHYIKPLTDGKYLVRYTVAGLGYTCDIAHVDIGKYLLVSSRPLPEVYVGGKLYSLKDMNKYKILSEQDLELMDTFEELDFSKTKTSQNLVQAMHNHDDDEYINVKFELEGSYRAIDSFDNWHNDLSGAYYKLVAFLESLHDKLINETLKDFDHIDIAHSDGLSVVSVKKADIEKIAQDDFVLYMDYVTDLHTKFINTYSPTLTRYSFDEIVNGYDENYNNTYVLIKVEGGVSAQSISFRFGDVIIRSGTVHPYFNYGYAVYDVADDKFYDIFDIRNNIDKYNNIEKYLKWYCSDDIDLVGDSDFDSKITILDATKIQRMVAKLENRYNRDRYYPFKEDDAGYVSDYDNDGVISVMDASAIQLALVACTMPQE